MTANPHAISCCQGKSACFVTFGIFSLILVENTMGSRPSYKGISSRLYREKALQRGDHAPSHAIINDPSFIGGPLGQEGQSLRDSADRDGDKAVPHVDGTVERTSHHFLQFLIVWLSQVKRAAPLPAANAKKFRQGFLELQECGSAFLEMAGRVLVAPEEAPPAGEGSGMRSPFAELGVVQYARTFSGFPERFKRDCGFTMSGQRFVGQAYSLSMKIISLTGPSRVSQRLRSVCNAGNRYRISGAKADCEQDCHRNRFSRLTANGVDYASFARSPRLGGELPTHLPKVGPSRSCSSMGRDFPHVALGRNEDGK